jgi:hypothetical protein
LNDRTYAAHVLESCSPDSEHRILFLIGQVLTQASTHPNQLTTIYSNQLGASKSVVTANTIGPFSFLANAAGAAAGTAGALIGGNASGTTNSSSVVSPAIPEYKPGKVVTVSLAAFDIFGNVMEVPEPLAGLMDGPKVQAGLCYYIQPLGEL